MQTISCCFFRTLFTGIERYTFVDPDYAFTDQEEQQKVEHKQKYLDYIATLRQNRQADKKRRYNYYYTNIVVARNLFQLRYLGETVHFWSIFLFSDFHQYNNDTDLGMKSGIGLKPPRVSTRELRSPETSKLG